MENFFLLVFGFGVYFGLFKIMGDFGERSYLLGVRLVFHIFILHS